MTAAPASSPSAARWIKTNLFHSRRDVVLTIVFGALAVFLLIKVFQFVFISAEWEVVQRNLKLLLTGRWPTGQLDTLSAAIVGFTLWGGLTAGIIGGRQTLRGTSAVAGMSLTERLADLGRRFGLIIATALLLLSLTTSGGPWLLAGSMALAGFAGTVIGRQFGNRILPTWGTRTGVLVMILIPIGLYLLMINAVPLEDWEGFIFSISSAAAGIALSFPLGVLLALGRRSKLVLLKAVSIVYIEFVRGSPLFVLLLLANVSLEFFVPAALTPSKVVRAIVTFTLFTAAYIAEIVRGGLQSVPVGQVEAAKAMGLSPAKQMRLIVLPQALRNVIPAQIGQFISLFKDTTLAGLALGILDLLAAGQVMTQQADFRGKGLIIEALVFVGFLFWVGSFTMSRESQRLERKLGVGTR
jgi:general L-amino acid transport system permease protein